MAKLGFSVEDLAGEDGIGVSKNTVYSPLIDQDLIPYIRLGRTVRLPAAALTRWLDFMAFRHVDICDVDAVRSAMASEDYHDMMRSYE